MTTHADTKVYVGAGNHELLRVLWTGFQDGLAYGRSHLTVTAYLEADHIVDTAKIACERKLQTVVPLDRALFHPAYTHGWMAGYLAAHHDLDDAVDGLSLLDLARLDPTSLAEHAYETDTGHITHQS